MTALDFPSLTNFIVCSIVTFSGLYWLRKFSQKYEGKNRFIFRSYFCWWLSWITWTVTWALITFTDWANTYPYVRLLLALSDLNAIFLITVYFTLTRGNTYKPVDAVMEFGFLCCAVAAGYGIFLLFLPQRFDHMQTGWGLCLSAISTLLVGWAFAFRYRTRAVLIIGYVYAFSQPIAFDAILHSAAADRDPQSSVTILAAFKIALAIFKVLWATVVIVYFTQVPATEENLVIDYSKGALPTFNKLPKPVFVQTLVLVATISVLLIIMVYSEFPEQAKKEILPILGALGALAGIITLLGKIFKWLRDHLRGGGPEAPIDHPAS
jgi:hypothetical protein